MRYSEFDLHSFCAVLEGSCRLAKALRQMHGDLAHDWTAPKVAQVATLSRSAFFKRFMATLGQTPMEYLLGWRMTVAKDLLRRTQLGMIEVAEGVGYRSASAFSTAFTRYVGAAELIRQRRQPLGVVRHEHQLQAF